MVQKSRLHTVVDTIRHLAPVVDHLVHNPHTRAAATDLQQRYTSIRTKLEKARVDDSPLELVDVGAEVGQVIDDVGAILRQAFGG